MTMFAYAMVWLSCSAAVSTAIYYTRDMKCLWFMIIPLFVSVKSQR